MKFLQSATLLSLYLAGVEALNKDLRIGVGGRTIHDFKREVSKRRMPADIRRKLTVTLQAQAKRTLTRRAAPDPEDLYQAHNISLPVDHFPEESKYEPHSNATFPNRYWFDTTYYQPGGPVTILQSGETDATGRLPFMQKGILKMISEATGGISVILEHRYYGESFPTEDLSTENLRFLTTEQALADQVYFAQNVVFPGMEDQDLTSKSTAYLTYGGSYAGAFVAILRVKYPDTFWGAISSSGVTEAIYNFWEYFAPVAEYGPPLCIATQKLFTSVFDNILIGKNDNALTAQLQSAIGMPNVTDVRDFANQLAGGIGYWQSLNWDPEVSSPEFYNYCNNITTYNVLYPGTEAKRDTAASLIQAGGYDAPDYLVNQMLNYIGYINATTVSRCDSANQDECFSNLNATYYGQHSLEDYDWRSWAYQYCSEWGYLQVGSSWPEGELGVISRLVDLNYTSFVCRAAFGIEEPSNVTLINQYGGYDIAADRLAIIDGEFDPWRPATPHAYDQGAKPRNNTIERPFHLIPMALHHYDENGRFPNETSPLLPPAEVGEAQRYIQLFTQQWMDEWNKEHGKGVYGAKKAL